MVAIVKMFSLGELNLNFIEILSISSYTTHNCVYTSQCDRAVIMKLAGTTFPREKSTM